MAARRLGLAVTLAMMIACSKKGGDRSAPGAARDMAQTPSSLTAQFAGVGFSVPTAALVDDDQDKYFVVNEGTGSGGFITKIEARRSQVTARWIADGVDGATLRAPSGIVLSRNALFVSDGAALRSFDRNSGRPLGTVEIRGATCLAGVAADLRGTLYAIDDGMAPCTRRREATRHRVAPPSVVRVESSGEIVSLLDGPALGEPTGIFYSRSRLWVATAAGEVFSVDGTRQKNELTPLPDGALGGIVEMPGGDLLVASHAGQVVYRGRPGARFSEAVAEMADAGGIAFDARRGLLLVPLAERNELRTYTLPAIAPTGEFPSLPLPRTRHTGRETTF
jgi:hypothetical protein